MSFSCDEHEGVPKSFEFVFNDVPLLNFDENYNLFTFFSVTYKYTDVFMSTILCIQPISMLMTNPYSVGTVPWEIANT